MDLVSGPPTEAEVAGVWAVARDALGGADDEAAWRGEVWDRHAARGGFRSVRAVDHGVVVGFAYGYTGAPGQWWNDEVSRVLDPAVVADWVGGHFELVSLAVGAGQRGRGLGRRLMTELTHDLPHRRWLLMTTADPTDPARRLYGSLGWGVLGPGVGEGTVVLGRSLPT